MDGDGETLQPSEADVDAALAALYAAPTFARSERLRTFLSYVVRETLAGRGDLIRAKTIAQDVYGRDPARDDFSDNVVRVDARRLRRALEDYYASGGSDAPLRISLPMGNYVPMFETRTPVTKSDLPPPQIREHDPPKPTPPVRRPQTTLPRVLTAAALVSAALVVAAYFLISSDETRPVVARSAERLALFDRSGAVLQADNLCAQGRAMLFPIADPRQQELATDLFERAIELAPDYACGFAGAAHSLATLALLASEEEIRSNRLSEARAMATRAQVLAPTDGWVVSALAWASLVGRELPRATELSKLSEDLSPTDGNVLDFHGVISLFTGDFEEARRATHPTRERDTSGLSHAHLNIYGVASLHAGDHAAAIAAWEDAIRLGEPVSALTLVYLTAAHQARGDHATAARYARDLSASWPGFQADRVIRSFYPDERMAADLLSLLSAAGWPGSP